MQCQDHASEKYFESIRGRRTREKKSGFRELYIALAIVCLVVYCLKSDSLCVSNNKIKRGDRGVGQSGGTTYTYVAYL